ncbi:hypothetical protein CHGG_05305 [Chaetomium globosum CBS 148.51]|uniref:Uncharacterized protein n=1 Tax=Chaetomium globosum (strain ATCC 6205 / CBS 148.51 / DSM 1962 / NBRC 6347 / NRRL 1970) TaxID=306901 RepID=Q2H7R0_CHAGB|nr:uncharacterized protein CHGG_05305 [Chaetomium globosum CBS 148.51]EAQ88686.1 hypothetical protein CHGG_05305 [Chaetomium globosum CBS 148.51]
MERERQYLRPRVGGTVTPGSETRSSGRPAEWPQWEPERQREHDSEREQPVKSILRKTVRPSTRPRRNSDTSVTSSNFHGVGSDSELGSSSVVSSSVVSSSVVSSSVVSSSAASSSAASSSLPQPVPSNSTALPRKVLKAKFPGIPAERQGVISLRPSRGSSPNTPSVYHVPPVRSVLSSQYTPDNRRHGRRGSYDRHDKLYHSTDPETESAVSEMSDLSSTTEATTIISSPSDSGASDVTPTETVAKPTPSVRFTPSVIGSESVASSIITPVRKAKPRLTIRAPPPSEADRTVVKSGSRSVQIKMLPLTAETPESRYTRELERYQQEMERSMMHRIDLLEADRETLRESEAKLRRELDDNSTRLTTLDREKAALEKERNTERRSREQVLVMLEKQKAVFDEFRSNFDLQKAMLEEVEKERDAHCQGGRQECTFKGSSTPLGKCLTNTRRPQAPRGAPDPTRSPLSKPAGTPFQEQRDNKDKEIAELLANREKLQTEMGVLTARVTATKDELKAAEEEQQKLRDTAKQERKAAEEEQQKIRDTAKQEKKALREELEEEHAAAKNRAIELEQQKVELETAKARVEQEKVEVEAKLDAAEGQIATLSTQVDVFTASTSDLNATIAVLEEEFSTSKAEVANLKTQIEGLESDKADLQKQIEGLDAEKTEMQAQIHTLSTDLAGAKDANISIASQKLDLAKEMAGVSGALTTAQAEITKLIAEKAAAQAAADAEAAKIPALESTKAELVGKVVELEGKVSESEATITELRGKVTVLQGEADKIPGLFTERVVTESKVADLEKEAASLKAKIAEVEAEAGKLPPLQAAKSELEGKVSSLEDQITQLQSELSKDPDATAAALRADLEAKGQEITRRIDEINTLTAANTTLSVQLGATQQQVNSLQESLNSVTQSYNTATGQVVDLQQRVDQLASASRRVRRSRTSSPQKKEKDRDSSSGRSKKDKHLMVVRNPGDRGALSVMLQIAAAI